MSTSPLHPAEFAAAADRYRCGTLTYSRRQLGVLFFWLLWGDFCYVLMEAVVPSIMPLKFKALDASNTAIGMVLVTVPMAINTVFNPIISFKSDRHRGRWGRRIPFILFTLPLLVVCLIGLGFGDAAGFWLHRSFGFLERRFSPNMVAIGVIGLVMVLFSFFNTFVNSTFWYLFNDVVPERLLARFMSLFRMVSLGSAALYNLLIFPYAGTHFREILLGAGIFYFVGFGLMCLNVREGDYPPPTPNLDGSTGALSAVKTFGQECHSHRHYWYIFLGTMASSLSSSIGTFMLFFYQSTGLNLTRIGQLQSMSNIAGATLIVGSGWLADRFHPIRVVLLGQTLQLFVVLPAMCIWLFWHPPANVAFWGWIFLSVGLGSPVGALIGVSDPPLHMRMFPRDNYGQFCAANAMWRSLGAIIGGMTAGAFLDGLKRSGAPNVYAFIPVWQGLLYVPVVFFAFQMFRSWQRYGGDAGYRPPMPSARTVLRDNMPLPPAIPGTDGIQSAAESVVEAGRATAEGTLLPEKR